jgi:hypothetical protein
MVEAVQYLTRPRLAQSAFAQPGFEQFVSMLVPERRAGRV